jgi:myosin heavy subunit
MLTNICHFVFAIYATLLHCTQYDVTAFLQKNNDSLQDSLLDLLDTSRNSFLVEVMHFQDQVSST